MEVVAPAWWPQDWVLGDYTHWRWHSGGCMVLALALHDLTGWPIYEAYLRGPHYVVKTADGEQLDHRGIMPWPKNMRGADPVSTAKVQADARKHGSDKEFPDAAMAASALLRDSGLLATADMTAEG
jgi:hypothetical protein